MLKFAKLGEIATLTVGFVGNMAKQYVEEGVPFLRSLNIKPFYISTEDMKYISADFCQQIKKSILKKGDVVIVRTGIPGTCAVVPEEFDGCNCSDIVIVHPMLDKVNPHYLAAYINVWGQKQISNNKVGAIQQHFNVRTAEEMLIAIPSLEEQNRIAKIIENLNNRIFNNQKINDNLQQQLQTMYGYLFNRQNVPVSWRKGILSDIANITMGQSPDGASYNENGDGCLFYQGSTDFGEIFPMARVYTTQPTRMAYAMDTLLGVRAPVGTMNIAYEQCCIGRGLAAIHGSQDNNIFVRYLLRNNQWYFDNINNGGTTFGSLTKDNLYGLPIYIPDFSLIQSFEQKASLYEKIIYNNEKENRSLISLRDWLLPVLMNGQVTIDD